MPQTAPGEGREEKTGSGRRPFRLPLPVSIIVLAVSPFLSLWLQQWMSFDPFRMYPSMLAVNAVLFYTLYFAVSFFIGSFRAGFIICHLFTVFVGAVNYFVMEFRGAPVVPWDIFSVRTAVSVAGGYTWSVTSSFVLILLGFALLILAAAFLGIRPGRLPVRLIAGAVCAAALVLCGFMLQKQSFRDWLGMDETLFTPKVRCRNNGFVATFVGSLYLINVEKPDGYSPERASEIIEETVGGTGTASAASSTASAGSAVKPNIIVVMNEAFSDLTVLGDLPVSEDPMPYFRSLMESGDYTAGHLMVSVKGGDTANTEYEFLSGDTMAFLPEGSVVYQQYIHDEVPGLVSGLLEQGYQTTAIHPYLATGWERDRVYDLLGFQEFLDINSFKSPVLMRGYVSDLSAFDKIVDTYEAKRDGGPQFIFEVTMQNHGGYSKDYPGFSATIDLVGAGELTSTRAAEKYLTLIKASDTAFEQLTNYFAGQKDPTIIVMFGDHEPSDYITNAISRITGYDPEVSLQERQRSYLVPYVVWNNFGMETDPDMDLCSVNYLSAWLMRQAGLSISPYQEFLLRLRGKVPVICAGCWIGEDGRYHEISDREGVGGEMLTAYQILQYNHLTDLSGRVSGLFTTGAS